MLHTLVQDHKLRNIHLSHNNFDVGEIPSIVCTMTKLQELFIGVLGFTGSIGCSIQHNALTRWMCVHTGTIPDLSGLTDLKVLSMHCNRLTGRLWLNSRARSSELP